MDTIDHLSETETESAARGILAAHAAMYLAVCTADDTPWVGGVHFAETGLFTLVLVLEEHGRTLAAIRRNPAVAMVVSTGAPYDPFLQGSATAEIVEGEASDEVHRVLVAKVPAVEAFLGIPHRSVRLTVHGWRVTDITRGWIPGRQLSPVASGG